VTGTETFRSGWQANSQRGKQKKPLSHGRLRGFFVKEVSSGILLATPFYKMILHTGWVRQRKIASLFYLYRYDFRKGGDSFEYLTMRTSRISSCSSVMAGGK
jgi:hypothetical protein